MSVSELKEVILEFKKLGDVGKSYLEKVGGIHYTTFCANNPYQSAYNEGRRSLALQLLSLINADEKKLKEIEAHSSAQTDEFFNDYWR